MFSLYSCKEIIRMATGQIKHLSNKQKLAGGASEWDTTNFSTLDLVSGNSWTGDSHWKLNQDPPF